MRSIVKILLLLLVFSTIPVRADDLIIYPAKGQSDQQQEKDKYQCYEWAKDQASQYQAHRNTCNRAYAACLVPRGYSVK